MVVTRTLMLMIPPERQTRIRRRRRKSAAQTSTATPIPIPCKISIGGPAQWELGSAVAGEASSARIVTPVPVTERNPPETS